MQNLLKLQKHCHVGILKAVGYIHDLEIAHLDLKVEYIY